MKSIVNDLDITPPLRFLLWRNVLFSNLFLLSFRFLPPFLLLSSPDAYFCQSSYLLSTSSNFFPIYLDILPQIFDHTTHTTTLPYTSLAAPSFCILHPPPLVILLLLPSVRTLQSTSLHFLSFLFSPKYLLQP